MMCQYVASVTALGGAVVWVALREYLRCPWVLFYSQMVLCNFLWTPISDVGWLWL